MLITLAARRTRDVVLPAVAGARDQALSADEVEVRYLSPERVAQRLAVAGLDRTAHQVRHRPRRVVVKSCTGTDDVYAIADDTNILVQDGDAMERPHQLSPLGQVCFGVRRHVVTCPCATR